MLMSSSHRKLREVTKNLTSPLAILKYLTSFVRFYGALSRSLLLRADGPPLRLTLCGPTANVVRPLSPGRRSRSSRPRRTPTSSFLRSCQVRMAFCFSWARI